MTEKDLRYSGNMQLSCVDHVSKNVVAVSNFYRNRQMLQEEKVRKSSVNHETALKLNEQILEKKREKNLAKNSKWEHFRVRRIKTIDAYLLMKKN